VLNLKLLLAPAEDASEQPPLLVLGLTEEPGFMVWNFNSVSLKAKFWQCTVTACSARRLVIWSIFS
jgi:hypothetical protein